MLNDVELQLVLHVLEKKVRVHANAKSSYRSDA